MPSKSRKNSLKRNIKLTIEYDGTNFKGWQIQRKGERTVQAEITKFLTKLCKEDIKLIGSGRTDTGVHATGQVANFKTTHKRTLKELQQALNANLPKDISILKAQLVHDNFHAQYSVKTKTYRYTILNRLAPYAQLRNFCLHYPYKLNFALIKDEAKALKGKHDFKSFVSANAPSNSNQGKRSSIRTIKKIIMRKANNVITIDIEADGFLYKMVRNIVGTLLEIGRKDQARGTMKKILKARNRNAAGTTAKAHGLTLLNVTY